MKRLSPDPDLEALVADLNDKAQTDVRPARRSSELEEADDVAERPRPLPAGSRWRVPEYSAEGWDYLTDLIGRCREAVATDLMLVEGAPPTMRIDGELHPLGEQPLATGLCAMLCGALVPEGRRQALGERGAVDFSLQLPEVGRIRCNVHLQRSHWSASIRLLSDQALELKHLNLPEELARYSELDHGLVLVTGPTGSGKTTTLAALIDRLLDRRKVHLITVEDPVEYEHAHRGSVVEHIEIGRDVPDFATALRSAMRQDPDVLLVGEMRDRESVSMAITAAETGHLVLSTLHTSDSAQSVHRILDSYPADQQTQIRAQLSISLAGIVSQQLLPATDNGRVPAVENLVATHAVRNLIRQGKVQMLRSQLTLERRAGMLSLDASLARLVKDGRVDEAEARARARSREEFDQFLRR